jgi:N-acetylglucosamine-6-phosphate deacetylase
MLNMGEVPMVEAIRMITHTPARIMKVDDRIGSLQVGMDADINIFDEQIRIKHTVLKGRVEIEHVKM